MNKNFCDRCGELIGNRADTFVKDWVQLRETDKCNRIWFIETSITSSGGIGRPDICQYCRDEMIDETYKLMVEKREKKENA